MDESKYMAIKTTDPLRITDILEIQEIPYVHIKGVEKPGKDNIYVTLEKVPPAVMNVIKRVSLVNGFTGFKENESIAEFLNLKD